MFNMSAENKTLFKRFVLALPVAFIVGCGFGASILHFGLESPSGVQGGCFGAILALALATLAASAASNGAWTMTFTTLIFGVIGVDTTAFFWYLWH